MNELTTAQEKLVELLYKGIPQAHLSQTAESVGLSATEASSLIDLLSPSLLSASTKTRAATDIDLRFAEIIRIGFETDETPEAIIQTRSRTLVGLSSLGRTELVLMKALTEAGFRNFQTEDYDLVSRKDLGELGYPPGLRGFTRLEAVRSQFLGGNFVTISHPVRRGSKPALSILSAMHRLNPKLYRELKTPHLLVEYGIDELRVSPIIRPGFTPCLGCRDLWDAESDPNWAATAIQLTARGDCLDDGNGLLMATAIAGKTICRYVDQPQATSVGFRVDLRSRAVHEWSWQRHPQCSCRLLG